MSSPAGPLAGMVAVVTGGGRGLGRAHSLQLADMGAAVLVNDVATGPDGKRLADSVAEEVASAGARAASHAGDVSNWSDAREMIDMCLDTFGRLDILVNNAGIVRDRTLARMSEAEWDDVLRVDLKGHAAPAIHCMAHWRSAARRTGEPSRAAIINTSSLAGLMTNFGQGNYASAKLGVVALSASLALEGRPIGVRSNVIAPSARTDTVLNSMGPPAEIDSAATDTEFDYWHPANVSPVVGWLASPSCRANGQVFHVVGNELRHFTAPVMGRIYRTNGRWTVEELDRQVGSDLPDWPNAKQFLDSLGQEERANE